MAGGRPTKYDKKYCKVAVEFMSQGYSVTALAGHIGVARSTIFKWAEDNQEFSDAIKEGQAGASAFWEKLLINNAITGEGNATTCIFGVKNRCRDDWQDKQQTELSGPDGGAIKTDNKFTVEIVSADK